MKYVPKTEFLEACALKSTIRLRLGWEVARLDVSIAGTAEKGGMGPPVACHPHSAIDLLYGVQTAASAATGTLLTPSARD